MPYTWLVVVNSSLKSCADEVRRFVIAWEVLHTSRSAKFEIPDSNQTVSVSQRGREISAQKNAVFFFVSDVVVSVQSGL